MPADSNSAPSRKLSPLIIAFLLLIAGTELMCLFTTLGVITVPGVRWDIMPCLSASLTMLACILPTFTGASPATPQTRRFLIGFIVTGILAVVTANIGLRPWAPSALYSAFSMLIGLAAFAVALKSMKIK